MKITIERFDGPSETFAPVAYMGMADRVAFERRFGVDSAELVRWGRDLKRISGDLDDDETDLPPGAKLNEEWIAFFVWRAARRGLGVTASFDEWIDDVAGFGFDDVAPDPTEPPPPGG